MGIRKTILKRRIIWEWNLQKNALSFPGNGGLVFPISYFHGNDTKKNQHFYFRGNGVYAYRYFPLPGMELICISKKMEFLFLQSISYLFIRNYFSLVQRAI